MVTQVMLFYSWCNEEHNSTLVQSPNSSCKQVIDRTHYKIYHNSQSLDGDYSHMIQRKMSGHMQLT